MAEESSKVVTEPPLVKNRLVDIYISCENEKRARDWYTNVLGLESLVMENGIRFILIEWGEQHKPVNESAVFSLQAPDIHKAYTELKARGAVKDGEEVIPYGADCLGFHVTDSEGNAIMIIDKAD
ncbi:VOC family protein [Paenibacillus sp. PR3]|uniref:VOC family protein n=1 Tax=Paenibacillus terricola TaxID=2763503 RepID=A0ABR8N1K3_9BACL|nr:VOC family protein [Paenibacillus terricola]MBD3922063.1 VOC family protein [Paenibacillus terricola]